MCWQASQTHFQIDLKYQNKIELDFESMSPVGVFPYKVRKSKTLGIFHFLIDVSFFRLNCHNKSKLLFFFYCSDCELVLSVKLVFIHTASNNYECWLQNEKKWNILLRPLTFWVFISHIIYQLMEGKGRKSIRNVLHKWEGFVGHLQTWSPFTQKVKSLTPVSVGPKSNLQPIACLIWGANRGLYIWFFGWLSCCVCDDIPFAV